MRRSFRVGLAALLGLALAATTLFGLLSFPEFLYKQRAQFGRLSLYSDSPFDPKAAEAVLADVERRLAAAPPAIADPSGSYRIFVSNDDWRRRLTFLWNEGAGGVFHGFIPRNVFLRAAHVDRDRLLKRDGQEVEAPRTLAYFAAHEIGHALIARRIGGWGHWRLPAWIREGLADYVGYAGEVDIDRLEQGLLDGERALDPRASGLYDRYRLLVAYYLIREGWGVELLLSSKLSQAEAELGLGL